MLFQIYDNKHKYERFCFNADNREEAEEKLICWLSFYNCLPLKNEFSLRQIREPESRGNIRDNWIPKKLKGTYHANTLSKESL